MKEKSKSGHRTIDQIDHAILSTLQQHGRISNVDLSQQVFLSPSPCLERVKRLENDGYIESYSANLNAAKLGLGKIAFIQVTLDKMTPDGFELFRESVAKNPYVVECNMVAGGYDYLIKVCFDDMDNYRYVLEQVVNMPHVHQTHTYVVIEEVKNSRGIPMDLVKA